MNHVIFVYGTLKSGHSRSSLLNQQRYLGTARTTPVYKMYRYGSFPALIESENGKSIYGELYEVSDSCVAELDEVEGVSQGLFTKQLVSLEEINLLFLPLQKSSSDLIIEGKNALAYFFSDKSKLANLKDCGRNWTM